MVRLEINTSAIWKQTCLNLHSSMVRLEIDTETQYNRFVQAFTFQYGQIRNEWGIRAEGEAKEIYIPVWLDQKS